MRHKRRAAVLAAAALVLAPLSALVSAQASAAPAAAAFTPALPLYNSTGASTLGAEPSIEVDSKGHAYVSAPAGVPSGGCPFWDVHPDDVGANGKGYDYRGTIDTDHGGAGGGDCDISILPATDPAAAYDRVSVTSLSLANLTSNVTTDGGKTFFPVANNSSQQVFGVDRQWQASDPTLDRHYLSVHDLATTNIQVSVSTDGGYQYVQNTPAINPLQAPGAQGNGGNHFGTTVVDPVTHKLYIPFLAPDASEPSGGNEHAVWVAEGDPCAVQACTKGAAAGPITWTDHLVYDAPSNVKLSHIFPAISIDKAGVVSLAFTGDTTKPASTSDTDFAANSIFFLHSRPRDVTPTAWTKPVAIDGGTAHSNMMPWLIAGAAGHVAAVWYRGDLVDPSAACGSRTGSANDADGVNNNCRNDWKVAYAQSDDGGATFTRSYASGVVHQGSVCDSGTACLAIGGDRTLLDFFDVALDPQGRPNIAFASDVREPATADVQYTRMCTGTSLTGLAIDTPCTQPGAPAVPCTASSLQMVDPAGDATQAAVTDTPSPSSPSLDLRQGYLTWDGAKKELTLHVRVTDLSAGPPPGAVGEYFRYYLTKKGDTELLAVLNRRATGNRFTVSTVSDPTDPSATTRSYTATGTFDEAKSEARLVLPASAWPTLFPGKTLSEGDEITTGQVLGQRDDGQATLTADSATGTCSFVVGTTNPAVPPLAGPSPSPSASTTASPGTSASPSASASAGPSGSASASPSASPSGSASASAAPSASSSASPAAGSSASPSPGGAPGGGSPSPAGPGGSPAASASPSPTPTPSSSAGAPEQGSSCSTPTLRIVTPSVQAGQPGQIRVDAVPGSTVRVFAYSRPSTTYKQVREAVVGTDGAVVFTVRPGGNTRAYAQVVGCSTQSVSATMNVRSTMTISAKRLGVRRYLFSGQAVPGRPGQIISLYYGRTLMAQGRTDSAGRYAIPRTFQRSARLDVHAFAGRNITADAGTSRTRPTVVH